MIIVKNGQLHLQRATIVVSTSNATLPQWQLPLYFMGSPLHATSVAREISARLSGASVPFEGLWPEQYQSGERKGERRGASPGTDCWASPAMMVGVLGKELTYAA